MANCFKTQLKEVVNNSNLPYFGMLTFSVENAVNRSIEFSATSVNKCKLLLDGVTLQVGQTQYTEEVPVPAGPGSATVVSTESGGMVKITDKYDIDILSLTKCTLNFTTKDLKHCLALYNLVLSLSSIEGELNDLVSLPLKTLAIDSTSITGDVTAFLNTIAANRDNGDTLILYVNSNCTNIPTGIGTNYATRGKVVFNGSGGWSVTTP